MSNNFAPSINILRNNLEDFDYTVTKNSLLVSESISKNFYAGFNSFTLIGSYGTGKSAFLVAFEKSLLGNEIYFKTAHDLASDFKKVEIIKIIGNYSSFPETLLKELSSKFDSNFKDIEDAISFMKNRQDTLFVIMIDEFGKFLEYTACENPKKDIYFLQKLAESIYDNNPNILFIYTLHQNFDAYASNLDPEVKLEWQKVKGRFKELTFNESADKLIYFLSKYTSSKFKCDIDKETLVNLSKFLKKTKFAKPEEATQKFIKDIYPFEPITAKVLTLALQEYGQNERSIFSFLNSEDIYSLNYYKDSIGFYSIVEVYEFLFYNLHSVIFSRNNPHYLQWSAIRSSIERVENVFEENLKIAKSLIKLIGLLSIFYPERMNIDKDFLIEYFALIKNVSNEEVVQAITELEKRKIIRFVNYKNKYVLFEGTDIDIEYEIIKASSHVEYGKDTLKKINSIFKKRLILAKKHFVESGTPRFFEFIISDSLINCYRLEKDGFVNLIFNENLTAKNLLEESKVFDLPGLFCFFKNNKKIKDLLFEYDKAKYVLANIADDIVATRELKNYIVHISSSLDKLINDSLYTDEVIWFTKGKLIKIKSQKDLNQKISQICEDFYYLTPIIKNELINKNKSSSAISNAWNNFVAHLINYYHEEDLLFEKHKYPPEKFIYVNLLKESGIHRKTNGSYSLCEPKKYLNELWKASNDFLQSTKSRAKTIAEMAEKLKDKPFGLKQTIIDFWIPIFLFSNKNNFALYGNKGFIPELSLEIFQLIKRFPERYSIKAFTIEGIKLDLFNTYRKITQKAYVDNAGKNEAIDTLSPFLSFCNSLPEYTKYTKNISKSAQNLRDTLLKASDLEKLLFEDIPFIMGYDYDLLKEDEGALERFSIHLLSLIKEIRGIYDELLNKVEGFVLQILGYSDMEYYQYKKHIRNRFRSLDAELLTPEQKLFLDRLLLETDSRETWLNALGYPIVKKNLDKLRDDEENFFFKNLRSLLKTLVNYVELNNENSNEINKKVYKVDITGFSENMKSYLININTEDVEKTIEIENKIQSVLKNEDQDVINYVLLKILRDINYEQN